MTIALLSLSDATEALMRNPSGILFCDTCSLLDIIRLPIRYKKLNYITSALNSISNIIQEIQQGNISFVIPTLVKDEWTEYARSIRNDVCQHIKGVDAQYTIIRTVALDQGTSLPEITFPASDLADHLYNLSAEILNSCIELIKNDECSLRATERSVSNIAPASKGESIQDCIIYEHVLEVMNRLQKQGFAGPKVFLTSNTKDYCTVSSSSPKPPVDTELKNANSILCTNWNWAINELKTT